MLLAHHPERLAALRTPSAAQPWRVLVSGCLAAWPCGVEGTDYGLGGALGDLLRQPAITALPFCPEQHALGTPRTLPDLHGGDGFDVLEGRARVLDERGADLTEPMLAGARAMLEFALAHEAELAILTDMSAACGSQVISDGCRLVSERRYQKGVGVATAMLLRAGLPVLSQRDFQSLAALRQKLGQATTDERPDHHDHPWTRANLPGPHPRR